MKPDRRSKPFITGDVPVSDDSNQKESNDWIQKAKEISGYVVALGAAASIMGSAWTYIITEMYKRDEAQKTQLTTYKTYGGYLNQYRTQIQPMIGSLLKDKERLELEREALELRNIGKDKGKDNSSKICLEIIRRSTTETGLEAFSSKEYNTYREVHNYYEAIGYALSEGQLDFEIIFNLITLPTFWNIYDPLSPWYKSADELASHKKVRTYLYPDLSVMLALRSCIGSNYFGKGLPLNDFSDYTDQLGYNYLFARMRSLYRRRCAPDGKLGSAMINKMDRAESDCDILRKRLNDMKRSEGKPASWMKLYSTTDRNIEDPILIKLFRQLSGGVQ